MFAAGILKIIDSNGLNDTHFLYFLDFVCTLLVACCSVTEIFLSIPKVSTPTLTAPTHKVGMIEKCKKHFI